MNITGKHITILGAVRSGLAAAKLAKKMGAVPFVSDMATYDQLKEKFDELNNLGIDYEACGHTDKVFECDFIVTSPGVPSNANVLLTAAEKGIEVISEMEFASWFCKGDIIAITGSNGKTTTTMLTAHVFNACGKKTYLAGNIGTALSDLVLDVQAGEVVALEVSSFQLDHIKSFKPKVSAILNVTPDHLDRYDNQFDNYLKSKLNIFRNQSAEDLYVLNYDDSNLMANENNENVKRSYFSCYSQMHTGSYFSDNSMFYAEDGKIEMICNADEFSLKGEHNIANALAVIIFAKKYGLDNESIKTALGNFPCVEHRLEFVREVNGVEYINDSKATNVDSVWYALRSFNKPLYLILGGKDKGNDYDQILDLVKQHVKKIYAIGSSAGKVYEYFSKHVDVEKKESLESCVETANTEADSGSILLLSPACASFDMFNSYEHRGKVFKEAVNKL